MSTTYDEMPDTQRQHLRRRAALLHQLRQHLAGYEFGADLPTAALLARTLGLNVWEVGPALMHLDTYGEIVYRGGPRSGRSYRLRSDEQHPDDVALDRDVREKIKSGHYQQGAPLPTGILADRYGLTPPQFLRACRRLLADRLIAHDENGPFGPGLYVVRREAPTGRPLTV
ncbi:hypothetical protein ABTY59_32295 [Streptomyces sp. NPDC096079]|uniref:hypothetical protein n=1 Tax=Streptomyces sp. NPDC096079 TaxID=3155820 RepID=UPI0033252FA0